MTEKQADKPRGSSYKLPFDLTILVLAHLLLLPLWIFLWTFIPLLIWLADRGPIFYKQERVGKDERFFTVLKFRTMVPDADRQGPSWTTVGDPRVTSVGRFLRRTALDELPELLSIWRRDMSFVGPRALDIEEEKFLEQKIPGFKSRLRVLPGLTGLAQIYNHSDDAYEKFRYDQEYIQRMGPWLDSKLLMLSLVNSLTAKWDQRYGKPADGTWESTMLESVDKEHTPPERVGVETDTHPRPR